jgi:Asp-tRNA(Asn)/Glu-tRNA(Gln) amidotransferase A subunit family amidase
MVEKPLQIARLRAAFLGGQLSASELIEWVPTRIAHWDDPAVWIVRTSDTALRQRAFELDAAAAADPDLINRLPLFGIPFAVKDNIDVAGTPTTAACPAFAYTPSETAPVVRQPLSAGAVLVGKTNLDQFAAGWSAPARPTAPRAIPSIRATYPAARAPARRWRWPPGSSALRAAPIPPARDAFRQPSTDSASIDDYWTSGSPIAAASIWLALRWHDLIQVNRD